jgi:hypothetical protein
MENLSAMPKEPQMQVKQARARLKSIVDGAMLLPESLVFQTILESCFMHKQRCAFGCLCQSLTALRVTAKCKAPALPGAEHEPKGVLAMLNEGRSNGLKV